MKNRHFTVTVNSKRFDISIEEGLGQAAPKRKVPLRAERKQESKENQESHGEGLEKAPMPGTILDVKVKPGDVVKKGQTLVLLEAMKMENEIPSRFDGTVEEVFVQKGASVGQDEPLVSIKG